MRRIVLFLSDIAVLYGSLILMLYIRYGRYGEFQRYYHLHMIPFGILFVLWLIIFYIAGMYDEKLFRSNLDFYSNFFRAMLFASGISIILFYFIPFFITPKTNLLIFISFFAAVQSLIRYLWHKLFETKLKRTVLIVGLNEHTLELANFIKNHPQFGYKLKYIANLEGKMESDIKDVGIIKNINEMKSVVEKESIDTVVVTPEAYRYSEIIDVFYKTIVNQISFYNLVSFYEKLTGKVLLGSLNQIWFLENFGDGKKNAYEISKRLLDIFLAVILGTTSLVLYPFIILAIKLSSRGSVFYKQKRLGQSGNDFKIIKFRTMVEDAEKSTGAVWASDNDPRTTKVGRFLRKTRLDEFPQLWNILRGEMSFVGPRAERPEFQDLLQKNVAFYEERYLIKPGLTGWAQINFRYGSSIKDAEEKLKYDLYYIKYRSLIFDLGIILKTIRIALQQAGQ